MNSKTSSAVFVFLLGISIFPNIDASTVPVIGWSSTRNLFSTRQIAAGEEISQESLRNDFLDKALGNDPQTVVLVLLNKLSLGDLTRFGDAYGSSNQGGVIPNIKSSMDKASSTMVLPQTDTSEMVEDLVSKVMGQQGEVTEINTESELTDLQIDPTKANLIIVRIEPSESMEEQLKAADAYIKTAMDLFRGKTPPRDFTVFFSAVKSAKHSSISSGRRLLESTVAPTPAPSSFLFLNFTSEDCMVYIYAKESVANLMDQGAVVPGKNNLTLPTEGWTTTGSSCVSNSSVDVTFGISDLQFNGTGAWISSVSISMKVIQTDGWWYVNTTTLSYQLKAGAAKEEEITLPAKLETPVGWSYHCGDITFAEMNSTGESLEVYFNDFQIQPLAVEGDMFSRANECVGFFTSGIWMGIITALLIIAVISFGITMMASVRVMDKFDDPKGKQLVINVPES